MSAWKRRLLKTLITLEKTGARCTDDRRALDSCVCACPERAAVTCRWHSSMVCLRASRVDCNILQAVPMLDKHLKVNQWVAVDGVLWWFTIHLPCFRTGILSSIKMMNLHLEQ